MAMFLHYMLPIIEGFHYKSFKEIFLMAEDSMNRSIETNKLIENAEEMLVDVPSSIYQTRENVQDATEALDIAESKCKCDIIHLLQPPETPEMRTLFSIPEIMTPLYTMKLLYSGNLETNLSVLERWPHFQGVKHFISRTVYRGVFIQGVRIERFHCSSYNSSYIAVNSISLFLNETQEVVDQFVFNVSSFISENERIISEIDNIVAGLANIHSRINKVRRHY